MVKEQELLRLRNARVLDINGEHVGKIGEIFLNDRTQEISFVTVALGILRAREVYVPYSLIDVGDEGVVIQVSREVVLEAPRSNSLGYLTKQQESELYSLYEQRLNSVNSEHSS